MKRGQLCPTIASLRFLFDETASKKLDYTMQCYAKLFSSLIYCTLFF